MKLTTYNKAMQVYINWCVDNDIDPTRAEKRPYWDIGEPTSWWPTERVITHEGVGDCRYEYEEVSPTTLVHLLNEIDGVEANAQRAYDTTIGIEFYLTV